MGVEATLFDFASGSWRKQTAHEEAFSCLYRRYVAAWQQGASLWELHERSYAGEFVEGAAMIAID